MTCPRPTRRAGLTLIELMAVMAVMLILAGVTFPSFTGLKGNADQKAAADVVRGRIADARGMAMEYGQAYRLAISTDGTRIRLAPDTLDFSSAPVVNAPGSAVTALETRLDKATAGLIADDDTSAPGGDGNWVTIGTFLPDGTCRETGSLIQIHEGNFPPIQIQLRGMSASARVLPLNATVNNTNGASSANSANGAKQGGG